MSYKTNNGFRENSQPVFFITFVCVEVLRPSQPSGAHVERGQFTYPHIYWAGLVL